MSVPNVLRESEGEIIDQSGSETHGLMYNSFRPCVHMSLSGESVCPCNTLCLHNVS